MKLAPGPKQKYHDSSMDGLAIVIRGNKATKNVATGDLVLVERSTISGVTDGGYKALANVSAGTAFTSANLSALSKGGLNALNDQIANKVECATYTESNLSTTAGTALTLGAVSSYLPTGKTLVGLSKIRAAGYSGSDNGSVQLNTSESNVVFIPTVTQTQVTVKFTVFYK